jgi:N4-gp56 family major capsid protein
MTTIAEFSISGLTDLDQKRYLEAAIYGFAEQSRWDIAISTDMERRKLVTQGRQVTFTKFAGIDSAVTSARTPGSDFTYTTPTETQIDAAWSPYSKAVRIDDASSVGSVVELIDSSMKQIMQSATGTFDYLAATAAIACTNVYRMGRSDDASIVATDILTLSASRRAFAALQTAKAPKFNIPGIGPTYLAYVHPHVAFDLKEQSSGIFSGAVNVNAPNYMGNVLGVAAGFLWIETDSQGATLSADAGSGAVDVYSTIFLADWTLGMVSAPVPQQPGCVDISLSPDRSIVARVAFPHANLGMVKEVGFHMYKGFKLIENNGCYKINSASSLGANT